MWHREVKKDHYVYCFLTKDLKIKIGYSSNVENRYKNLSRTIDVVEIYGAIKFDDQSSARRIETSIHASLKSYFNNEKKTELYPFSPTVLGFFSNMKGSFLCHNF